MAIVVTRSVTSGEVDQKAEMLDLFYPVGSYYETSDTSFDPNTAWGGTWNEDTAGRVLVAMDSGTFDTVGDTGGEETHTLDVTEIPSHNHQIHLEGGSLSGGSGHVKWSGGETNYQLYSDSIESTGGSGAHNNLQPYIVIKRWHRTA